MAEASAAGGAGIGLLPGVDEHVRAQVRYLGGEGDLRPRRPEGPSPRPRPALRPLGLGAWPRSRLGTCTKREPHVSHLYGFSPEWMRLCVFRLAGRLKRAPQMEQW